MSRAAIDNSKCPVSSDPLAGVSAWLVYLELSKPGITRMVVIASVVGFALAAMYHTMSVGELVLPFIVCVIGTAIASAGANGLNQWAERHRDGRMNRTMGRPLPSGRLAPASAFAASVGCSVLGPAALLLISPLAALAAAATVLMYVLVYTPMKPRSSMATLVGAVPGALPVVIGWLTASPSGAGDLLEWPVWSVFLVLLVWQLPHFLAIASMYREDYRRGGFCPIPGDAEDRVLAWVILAWSVALVASSLAPSTAMPNRVGWLYVAVALLAGLGFVASAIRLVRRSDRAAARGVFLASIAYLPLVLFALVADAAIPWHA
ncbi:MAG: heme o synthase [Phycisphaerales bacterium]